MHIMHKAKWTPRQISLLPSVSQPRSIIRQLRKSLTFFTAIPVFYRFRGEERKRRVQLSVCDESGEMPCLCASEKEGRSGKTSNRKRNIKRKEKKEENKQKQKQKQKKQTRKLKTQTEIQHAPRWTCPS